GNSFPTAWKRSAAGGSDVRGGRETPREYCPNARGRRLQTRGSFTGPRRRHGSCTVLYGAPRSRCAKNPKGRSGMTKSGNKVLSIDTLPDDARLWIYACDRELNELEELRVKEILTEFCADWTSHGRSVESAADVIEGKFALIGGHIVDGDVSGCGIDKSTRA